MTMQQIHPDDERLAALAGGDPHVPADAGLRAHVSACDRCGPMVAELQQLRTALADLPDLVPSRPLQLIPPVPAAAERASGGWLRRLAAPMMAAGVLLVIVASVGGSGALNGVSVGLGGAAAAPSAASSFAEDDVKNGREAAVPFPVNLFFTYAPARLSGQSPEFAGGAGSSRNPVTSDSGGKASQSPGQSQVPAEPPAVSEQPVLSINPWGLVLLIGALGVLLGGVILVTQPGRGP
ncbi:MAG TPA: hypothetical protein VF153_03845 [Candidatus Limnocylindria bacterium]